MRENVCFVENCKEEPEYRCSCTHSAFVCFKHSKNHGNQSSKHEITDLKDNEKRFLNTYQLDIIIDSDTDVHVHKIVVGGAKSTFLLFTSQEIDIELPLDYSSCLNKMADAFAEKIKKIEKQNTKKIPLECKKFFRWVAKVIPNLYTNEENFIDNIRSDFLTMHSEVDSILLSELVVLIDILEKECYMPKTIKRFIIEDLSLESFKQNFFFKAVQIQEFDLKKIQTLFGEVFSPFIKNNKNLDRFFTNFEAEYRYQANIIYDKYIEEIKKDAKATFMGKSFQKVSVLEYKKLNDLNELTIALKPEWDNVFTKIFEKETIVISQVLEIPNDLLITIVLPETKRTYLMPYSNFKTDFGLIFESDDILIASGSTQENIIVFIPECLEFFRCAIIKKKIVVVDKIVLKYNLGSRIISIVYISSADRLIFLNLLGDLVDKIDDSDNLKTLDISLCSERCLGIYTCSNIIILRTEYSLLIYDFEFTLLYNFNFKSSNLVVSSYGTQIFFYRIDQNTIEMNLLELNKSELADIDKIVSKFNKFSFGKKAKLTIREGEEILNIAKRYYRENIRRRISVYSKIYKTIDYVISNRCSVANTIIEEEEKSENPPKTRKCRSKENKNTLRNPRSEAKNPCLEINQKEEYHKNVKKDLTGVSIIPGSDPAGFFPKNSLISNRVSNSESSSSTEKLKNSDELNEDYQNPFIRNQIDEKKSSKSNEKTSSEDSDSDEDSEDSDNSSYME
jgi:hypothetical protein